MNAVIREVRRRLGRLRHEVMHGRADRQLAQAADAARRGWIAQAAGDLPSLPTSVDVCAEVHTLCGEGQFAMGLWSSWSLMRFLPNARLVVHSDGSLSAQSCARWEALIPGVRMLERDAGLVSMADHLSAYPKVLEWTRQYHFGFKLGGLHALVEAPRLIDMDTDVITLQDPHEVRALLDAPGKVMAWNRDLQQCLAYPEPMLRQIINTPLEAFPDRLNGGFMVLDRLKDADWALFEEAIGALQDDPRTDPLRYWMHQTLFAILSSTKAGADRLPERYDIHMGATRKDAAVRHYVGHASVRPRFFTEGVPAVIRDARARGQLPQDFYRDVVPDR